VKDQERVVPAEHLLCNSMLKETEGLG